MLAGMRGASLIVSTQPSRPAAWRISAGQIHRRGRAWLAQNRGAAAIAFSATAAVALALLGVALLASAPPAPLK